MKPRIVFTLHNSPSRHVPLAELNAKQVEAEEPKHGHDAFLVLCEQVPISIPLLLDETRHSQAGQHELVRHGDEHGEDEQTRRISID